MNTLKHFLFETKFSARGVARAGLAFGNIGLGLFFFRFLSISTTRMLPPLPNSFHTLIQYIPNFIVIGLSGVFFILAFAIWRHWSVTRSLAISATITCIVPLWFLLIFAQLFGTKFLLLSMVVIIAITGILLWRTSLKIAGVISLITIILTGLSFLSGFEEDYCFNKGIQAESARQQMVTATKQDAQIMRSYGIMEGQSIGVGFRIHILCHSTFRFSDALKETMVRQ